MPEQSGSPVQFWSEGVQTGTLLPDGSLTVKQPGSDAVQRYAHWREFLREIDPGIADSTSDAECVRVLATLLGAPRTADGQPLPLGPPLGEAPAVAAPPAQAPVHRRRGRSPKASANVQEPASTVPPAVAPVATAAPDETTSTVATEAQPGLQLARDVRRVVLRHGAAPVLCGIAELLEVFEQNLSDGGFGRTKLAEHANQARMHIAAAVALVPEELAVDAPQQ